VQLAAKIAAVQAVSGCPFRFYNANVETLLFTNELGGSGFSGISANFYPWLHAYVCSKVRRLLATCWGVGCFGWGVLSVAQMMRVVLLRSSLFQRAVGPGCQSGRLANWPVCSLAAPPLLLSVTGPAGRSLP
jgi:hypothetical protein